MAKEQDTRKMYGRILEKDMEQLPGNKVEQMQKSCGPAPEHFRDMVRNAVAEQVKMQESEEVPKMHKTVRKRKRKKGRAKAWFLAAAVFAFCGIAAASGSSWLKRHLLERGFTESEAEVLLETELPQESTENMDVVFPYGAEVKEAEWTEGILTVKEAYFDGTSLYFIAEASKEAEGCELYLKDHASVNGYDGMTMLQELEDEGGYLGRIELTEEGAADEILQAESVEVSMTVMSSLKPEEYEGRLLYTWKDAEAYEQIFGTGAFQSQYGPCCVMSQKEAAGISYTPQRLTMELPLTESAKQVIEQYRREGRLEEGETAEKEQAEVTQMEAIRTEEEQTEVAQTEAIRTETEQTETIQKGHAAPEISGSEENHVLFEIPTASGNLKIDAQIIRRTDSVYTGILQAEPVSEAALKSLYDEGEPGQWKARSSEESQDSGSAWQYQDRYIFASGNAEHTHYQNDEVESQEEAVTETAEEKVILKEQSEQVLEKLGMEGIVTENTMLTGLPQKYYQAQLLLEDLPVARYSQWNTACMIDWTDGELVGVNAPGSLKVLEKEEAELPDMEKILECVAEYAAAGEIEPPQGGAAITEISLEYYIDLTRQGLIFRPIWNFKLPYLDGPEDAGAPWAENYFYIDALTGALIRGAAGW